MSDLRKAAQAALGALDGLSEDAVCQSSHHAKKDRHTSLDVCPVFLRVRAAITTLRAALAIVPSDCPDSHQPEPQPVAWTSKQTLTRLADFDGFIYEKGGFDDAVALYTSPPQRKPLTDDAYRQLMKHAHRLANDGHGELAQYLRDAIDIAHGIGSKDE